MGARALYLYVGGQDTLYRIHGTNQRVDFFHMDAKGSVAQLLALQAHLDHGSDNPRFSILPNGRVDR
jgi:hypothetical protein